MANAFAHSTVFGRAVASAKLHTGVRLQLATHTRAGSLSQTSLLPRYFSSFGRQDNRGSAASRPAAHWQQAFAVSTTCRRSFSTTKDGGPKQSPVLGFASDTHDKSVADAVEEEASRTRVWTVPNALSVLRMALGPVIAHSIFAGDFASALGMLGFAGALDWADGAVARRFKGQASLLGSYLDPLGDKVLMACTGLPLAIIGALHPFLVFIVVGRDALLVGGSLIYRWRFREPGEPYFSLSKVTYKVEPSTLSKVNTGMQIGLVFTAIASMAWPHAGLALDAATVADLPQWLQDAALPLPLDAPAGAGDSPAIVDTPASTASAQPAVSAVSATSDIGAGAAAATAPPPLGSASRLLTLAPAVTALSWVVGSTTVATGLDYLFKSGMGFGRVAGAAAAAAAGAVGRK